jgi:hypothetical protein
MTRSAPPAPPPWGSSRRDATSSPLGVTRSCDDPRQRRTPDPGAGPGACRILVLCLGYRRAVLGAGLLSAWSRRTPRFEWVSNGCSRQLLVQETSLAGIGPFVEGELIVRLR